MVGIRPTNFVLLLVVSSFDKVNSGKQCKDSLLCLLHLFCPGGWKANVRQHTKSVVSLILMFALN